MNTQADMTTREVDGVVLTLFSGGSLSGKVVHSSSQTRILPLCTVNVSGAGTGGMPGTLYTAVADERGAFAFEGIPAGVVLRFQLRAAADQDQRIRPQPMVQRPRTGHETCRVVHRHPLVGQGDGYEAADGLGAEGKEREQRDD